MNGTYFNQLPGDSITFSQLMKQFLDGRDRKVSPNMMISYGNSLKHLEKYFGTNMLTKILP